MAGNPGGIYSSTTFVGPKIGTSTPWRFSTATSLGLLLQDWVEKIRGCRSLSFVYKAICTEIILKSCQVDFWGEV